MQRHCCCCCRSGVSGGNGTGGERKDCCGCPGAHAAPAGTAWTAGGAYALPCSPGCCARSPTGPFPPPRLGPALKTHPASPDVIRTRLAGGMAALFAAAALHANQAPAAMVRGSLSRGPRRLLAALVLTQQKICYPGAAHWPQGSRDLAGSAPCHSSRLQAARCSNGDCGGVVGPSRLPRQWSPA